MILSFQFLCLSFILVIVYFLALKPYLQILKLKKQFQNKGYRVLVQPLNFTKQMIFDGAKNDIQKHKDAFWSLKHTYTKYDIIIKNSMNRIYVGVSNIEILQEIFKKIQTFQKTLVVRQNFQRFYGGGLAISQGKQWKIKRKLYSEIFNFKLMEEIHPGIVATVEQSINQWDTGKQADIMADLRTMFFNMFVIAYFGKKFDQFSYKGKPFSQSMIHLIDMIYYQSYTWRNILFGPEFLKKGYTAEDKQIEELMQAVKCQSLSFIQKRYNQMKEAEEEQNNILAKVVFNKAFSQLSEQEKSQMLKQIVGDVIGLFSGNTDTGSSTLCATLHLLTKNPNVLQKLREEQEVQNSDFTLTSMKKLKYMDAVFNQTLRLYGPANWIFVRQIMNETTQIQGINLPKGTFLGIQNVSTHCSETYYQNPYEFNPQRWLSGRKQQPFSFVAFSAGQRNCIGQHLAKIEYKIALSKIIRKFDFQTKDQLVMGIPFTYCSLYNKFTLTSRQ